MTHRGAWLLAPLMLWPMAACSRGPSTSAGATGPATLTPRQTIERIIALRRGAQYSEMERYIVAARRGDTLKTLSAVDDFLAANDELCHIVQTQIGLGLAESIDQSALGANLDIFSRYVEVLDERSEGDSATVAFQVDRKLPLRRATLRRTDGVWLYDPGPGYQPEIPAAFSTMARGLRLVSDDLRSGRLSPEAVKQRPELLLEEIKIRLSPGAKLLPAHPAAGDGK